MGGSERVYYEGFIYEGSPIGFGFRFLRISAVGFTVVRYIGFEGPGKRFELKQSWIPEHLHSEILHFVWSI